MRDNCNLTYKQIKELIDKTLSEKIFAKGKFYLSSENINPASVLGFGTWEPIDAGTVLMCASSAGGDNKFVVNENNIEQFSKTAGACEGTFNPGASAGWSESSSAGNICSLPNKSSGGYFINGQTATAKFDYLKISIPNHTHVIGKTGSELESIDLTNKLKHPKLYAWVRTA